MPESLDMMQATLGGLMSASGDADCSVGSPEATGRRRRPSFSKNTVLRLKARVADAAHTRRACLMAEQSCWSVFVIW